MKKIGIFFTAMVFVVFFLIGCVTNKTEVISQYYSAEMFRISVDDYNSVLKPMNTTFSDILSYIIALNNYSVENSSDVITEDGLYQFVTQRGFSKEDSDANIKHLNSVGNNFFIFKYAYDENYFVVMYVEKIETLPEQTDKKLNGNWAGSMTVEGIEIEFQYHFDNGNYELLTNGNKCNRGTYTTGNGKINWNVTHIGGEFVNAMLEGVQIFKAEWYTKNDFIITFKSILLDAGISEEKVTELIAELVDVTPNVYSVDINSLIMTVVTSEQEVPLIMSRK